METSPFYLLLQTTIEGAAQRNLPRQQLAEILRPVFYPEDEEHNTKEYNTKEAAAELGKARSTMERWRCYGGGPEYFKDEHGGIIYTSETLQEYKNKRTFIPNRPKKKPRNGGNGASS